MSKPLKQIDPASYAKNGSEHGNQVALFCCLSQMLDKYPCLRLAFAIPNGGLRNPKVAAQLQAEGVKSGVPDICLPVPVGRWHGLYLEGKIKGRKLSEDQEWYGKELQKQGYGFARFEGWEQARDIILAYLNWKGE